MIVSVRNFTMVELESSLNCWRLMSWVNKISLVNGEYEPF